MCDASKLADDWITKGFHIHINSIELRVFPDHRGSLNFGSVFTQELSGQVDVAIRIAREKCLPNPTVRQKWLKRLNSAIIMMIGVTGDYKKLANCRVLEFKFLRIALERWEVDHGNS
jgi:hypothetical protein